MFVFLLKTALVFYGQGYICFYFRNTSYCMAENPEIIASGDSSFLVLGFNLNAEINITNI